MSKLSFDDGLFLIRSDTRELLQKKHDSLVRIVSVLQVVMLWLTGLVVVVGAIMLTGPSWKTQQVDPVLLAGIIAAVITNLLLAAHQADSRKEVKKLEASPEQYAIGLKMDGVYPVDSAEPAGLPRRLSYGFSTIPELHETADEVLTSFCMTMGKLYELRRYARGVREAWELAQQLTDAYIDALLESRAIMKQLNYQSHMVALAEEAGNSTLPGDVVEQHRFSWVSKIRASLASLVAVTKQLEKTFITAKEEFGTKLTNRTSTGEQSLRALRAEAEDIMRRLRSTT